MLKLGPRKDLKGHGWHVCYFSRTVGIKCPFMILFLLWYSETNGNLLKNIVQDFFIKHVGYCVVKVYQYRFLACTDIWH